MNNKNALVNVAEVELVYRTKVKASERPSVSTSSDAAQLFRALWEEGKLELIEQCQHLEKSGYY